jgi:hypothetical protein
MPRPLRLCPDPLSPLVVLGLEGGWRRVRMLYRRAWITPRTAAGCLPEAKALHLVAWMLRPAAVAGVVAAGVGVVPATRPALLRPLQIALRRKVRAMGRRGRWSWVRMEWGETCMRLLLSLPPSKLPACR